MIVTVITRTIRPAGALRAAQSVQAARELAPDIEVRHVIAYWNKPPDPHTLIADWLTELIAQSPAGWVFGLDDDNLMHPRFLLTLQRAATDRPDAWALLFAMEYPQFPGGVLRPQLPPRGGHVDGGQVALWRDYAVLEKWRHGGFGDGEYLAALYAHAPDRWVCVPEVVTHHNAQRRNT